MGAWGAVGLEDLESRRLLAYVPVDTSDASYDLVIDGINTAATPMNFCIVTLHWCPTRVRHQSDTSLTPV